MIYMNDRLIQAKIFRGELRMHDIGPIKRFTNDDSMFHDMYIAYIYCFTHAKRAFYF